MRHYRRTVLLIGALILTACGSATTVAAGDTTTTVAGQEQAETTVAGQEQTDATQDEATPTTVENGPVPGQFGSTLEI